MHVTFKGSQIKAMATPSSGISLPAAMLKIAGETEDRWNRDREHNFSLFALEPELLDQIVAFCSKAPDTYSGILQKISQFKKVLANPGRVVKVLSSLQTAITAVIMKSSKDRLLWSREKGFPVLVTSVDYHPAQKESPASVSMNYKFIAANVIQASSLSFDYDDIKNGATAEALLLANGFILETPELVRAFKGVTDKFNYISSLVYNQLTFSTSRLSADIFADISSWRRSWRDDDGSISEEKTIGSFRVVNDMPQAEQKSGAVNRIVLLKDLRRSKKEQDEASLRHENREEDDDEQDEEIVEDEETGEETKVKVSSLKDDHFILPTHPYVLCFNMETHTHMWVDSGKLQPYEYDTKLVDKLILPPEHKELIHILSSDPDQLRADIIGGKSAGTIVLCYGEPGLGKTLTAEATSEGQKRILYRVQSDQLGINVDSIEKRLKEVFARATRWNALLLIDECDIYVRDRGTDIHQNAIVGTLLRTLEYYDGMIFLTTNRAIVIDDAIVSRCSAIVHYDYPTPGDAFKLWQQYAKLFNITIDEKLTNQLVEHYKLSGRSIKNLLRLTARRGFNQPTFEQVKTTGAFVLGSLKASIKSES